MPYLFFIYLQNKSCAEDLKNLLGDISGVELRLKYTEHVSYYSLQLIKDQYLQILSANTDLL